MLLHKLVRGAINFVYVAGLNSRNMVPESPETIDLDRCDSCLDIVISNTCMPAPPSSPVIPSLYFAECHNFLTIWAFYFIPKRN